MIAAFVVAFFIFAGLYGDWLWYEQLGFSSVLATQWIARVVMFLIGFVAMAVPVYVSIELAFRSRPIYAKLNAQLDRYQQVIEPLRRLASFGIPAVLGFFAGIAASSRWTVALQWLNRTDSGKTDPQFGLDVSFYLFELPFYQSVVTFASAVVLLSAIAAVATSYLYGAVRFTEREIRISKSARIQFAVTGAVYLVVQAVSIWLDQYATLTKSSSGLLFGASYTDANAVIPGKAILAGIAAVVAVLFIVTAVVGRWKLPIVGTALLIVSSLLVGTAYPWIVQRFQVMPSERSLEAPFLERNIEATRDAYGLAEVKETPYSATVDVEAGQLRDDAETTASIRIVDPALVTSSFAQLEQIKQYYTFTEHLDVDRYTIDGEVKDTVIAVRELDTSKTGNTWQNNVTVYTHGYGVVAAAGNKRTVDGMPSFMESGIPSKGELGNYEPRIYFGEKSPTYSIVGGPKDAKPVELDYPSDGEESSQNARTTFRGDGGPKLDNFFKQLVYAIKFQSEQIVLSADVNSDSQILYDRSPRQRVKNVAPYLTLDSDAYPAIVDEKVVWIVDGYTTSDNYPYSEMQSLSNSIIDTNTPAPDFALLDQVNYIRNSVKATVDAYSGEVTLYTWDDKDPVLKTWQKIFPSTTKPMSEMSDQLLEHVRYPADLFKMQRSILGAYHVTNTDSFYSGDDAWVTPKEPTAPRETAKAQPPYYLSMQMPGEDKPAFSLYSTYIPRSEGEGTRNVLTGYLSVNADAGPNYGKFTLLTLPKQVTVRGPGQVQNDFNADPKVSKELNLLSQGSTQVRKGNLLTLPVGGGLLYVQPVYVQSTGGTSYPVLQKVLVSFGDQIAFESTLDAALDVIFGGDSGANAGDGDVPVDPDAPILPPVDGENPAEPSTPTDPSDQGSSYDRALQDAKKALDDREAAYAANDLVAAAQADKRLQVALEKLFAETSD